MRLDLEAPGQDIDEELGYLIVRIHLRDVESNTPIPVQRSSTSVGSVSTGRLKVACSSSNTLLGIRISLSLATAVVVRMLTISLRTGFAHFCGHCSLGACRRSC